VGIRWVDRYGVSKKITGTPMLPDKGKVKDKSGEKKKPGVVGLGDIKRQGLVVTRLEREKEAGDRRPHVEVGER
jgi:hypothetical protein